MGYDTGPGGLGQAVDFGSVYKSLYVDVEGMTQPGDGPLSLATWFRTTERSYQLPAVFGAGDATGDAAALEISFGRPSALVRDTGQSPSDNRLTHAANLDDGQWHHLAMTFTGGDDDTLRLFVDGRFSAAGTRPAGTINISDWNVAREYGGSDQYYYAGSLDDVRMYDRALSAGDVRELYTLFVPEPGTLVLLACGLLVLPATVLLRRSRR